VVKDSKEEQGMELKLTTAIRKTDSSIAAAERRCEVALEPSIELGIIRGEVASEPSVELGLGIVRRR
jgi:hypothetical protein